MVSLRVFVLESFSDLAFSKRFCAESFAVFAAVCLALAAVNSSSIFEVSNGVARGLAIPLS